MAVAVQKIRNAVDADRIAELVQIISEEHVQVAKYTRLTLDHALRCGDALNEAHDLVPYGEWEAWLDGNVAAHGVNRTNARNYMRLARNRHLLAEHDNETVYGALRILRSLPEIVGGKGMFQRRKQFSGDPAEAVMLYADGATFKEIADHFGVGVTTVYYYIHPAKRELARSTARQKRQQLKRAQYRIDRDARDAAARNLGAGVSKAYSELRRLIEVMDELWSSGVTPELRVACGETLNHLYAAEDSFNGALKASPVVSRKRGTRPKKAS